jgi:hypothetical protein
MKREKRATLWMINNICVPIRPFSKKISTILFPPEHQITFVQIPNVLLDMSIYTSLYRLIELKVTWNQRVNRYGTWTLHNSNFRSSFDYLAACTVHVSEKKNSTEIQRMTGICACVGGVTVCVCVCLCVYVCLNVCVCVECVFVCVCGCVLCRRSVCVCVCGWCCVVVVSLCVCGCAAVLPLCELVCLCLSVLEAGGCVCLCVVMCVAVLVSGCACQYI